MYRIEVYNKDFSTKLTTLFLGADIYNLSYGNEINKPGDAQFTITVKNDKATPINIKPFNKIIIYKEATGKFIGSIDSLTATVNELRISCIGMLGLFKRRITSKVYHTTTVEAAFEDILDVVNVAEDTGITFGVTTISQVLNRIELSRVTSLSAWQKLANLADQGEFIINTDKTLDFKTRIGQDKSAIITLQYLVDQINTANIEEFEVDIESKEMVNKVVAIGRSIYSTKSDPTSITEFGLLEATLNELQTFNQTDLDTEAQNFVDARSNEFYVPKVTPNISKIDIESLQLGDTVKVVLQNGFITVNQNQRILRIDVDVSNNGTEKLDLNMQPVTTNILPSPFIEEDIIDLGKRVGLLEGEF